VKRLAVVVLLLLSCGVAKADSVNVVAQELKAACDIPFKYGVAQDLASNLLVAQSLASYAGPVSLELSIESVLRAITIDAQRYVGFADTCPITWLQSRIAIDPNASVTITPSSLYFGEVAVSTPEPLAWLLILTAMFVGLVALFVAKNLFGGPSNE